MNAKVLLSALNQIIEARDYRVKYGVYPSGVGIEEFDDWAADVARKAIVEASK